MQITAEILTERSKLCTALGRTMQNKPVREITNEQEVRILHRSKWEIYIPWSNPIHEELLDNINVDNLKKHIAINDCGVEYDEIMILQEPDYALNIVRYSILYMAA